MIKFLIFLSLLIQLSLLNIGYAKEYRNPEAYSNYKFMMSHLDEIQERIGNDIDIEAVKDGFINVLTLQLAGKKRMNVADFLRGYRTSDNNKVE